MNMNTTFALHSSLTFADICSCTDIHYSPTLTYAYQLNIQPRRTNPSIHTNGGPCLYNTHFLLMQGALPTETLDRVKNTQVEALPKTRHNTPGIQVEILQAAVGDCTIFLSVLPRGYTHWPSCHLFNKPSDTVNAFLTSCICIGYIQLYLDG